VHGCDTKEVNNLDISSVILEINGIGYSLTNSTNAEIQQNIIGYNNFGIGSNSNIHLNVTSNLISGNLLTGITFLNTNYSNIAMNNIVGSQNGISLMSKSS
jgi:hypothetical protein